ncbi:enoyl-CoA hydratase/isomerase family protein [Pimelobacter simplex]|uniref:Enoyl-CoA hydratase n=1 Tax=Nocardioides simplex TaxID=2045 RepID=A0A0A1DKD6_NOCSI|nr:enoyl-CoA hydratase-related protein [Pimelobacter simplex]AIY17876.1 Enoyl-CoA hydratase [Pimelobacter simplex]MCG8152747.1 enoyl-CoA hydratase/isomerase family protein [Pimelobacter simplex]GEB16882.1 enoyl-CoA hydratase [Pimelobacter simplex]SFM74041.1 Enoyl-CoA hydratase/carnithine racemase [Pimelobacter simplex]
MSILTEHDGVHVLTIGATENRFTADLLTAIDEALDHVEAAPAPLVTVAEGKFFSNGLDLDWVLANPDELGPYSARVEALLARFLTLPVPTVAAVNGHAFGAGAMLAMAHDWRVMRADRGYFCFPEVDIRIPFTPGMAALIQAKLTPRAALDSMATGRRYGGAEAEAIGLVDATATDDRLLADAVARVAPLAGKDAPTLGAIKSTMYADAARALRHEQPQT